MPSLTDYLLLCPQHRASDLHLSSGQPPYVRVDGDLTALGLPRLSADEVWSLAASACTPLQLRQCAHASIDFSWALANGLRFRGHVFGQRQGLSLAFRLLQDHVPSLAEIKAPPALADLLNHGQGLILCTGPTGSGKSTTLAAMIANINQHQRKHLISLEAPIEYLHASAACLIQQRELADEHMGAALTAALRADPDVLVLGELRDLNSIRLALTAAETGHLVLATLHSNGAANTLHRIVDAFPEGEKNLVQTQLATSLVAIVAQRLFQKQPPPGRLAAFELLINTPAVAHLIREHKIAHIPSILQTQMGQGMQTMAHAISQLKQQRLI